MSEPLIGYVVIDDYEEGMGNWNGFIAYPNPEGANLFWEKPEPFIQKSAFDELKRENEKLNEQLSERQSLVFKLNADFDSLAKQNEILKAALINIKDRGYTRKCWTCDGGEWLWDEACTALAEVAKLEGAK